MKHEADAMVRHAVITSELSYLRVRDGSALASVPST